MDYLVSDKDVDGRRIVVTGHSRLGKAALVAAAFDERIALAIPHQAGCGGSAPSRAKIAYEQPWNTLDTPTTKRNETVADLNDKFPFWFNAAFKEFSAEPERLPFDQNCLVALSHRVRSCSPTAGLTRGSIRPDSLRFCARRHRFTGCWVRAISRLSDCRRMVS